MGALVPIIEVAVLITAALFSVGCAVMVAAAGLKVAWQNTVVPHRERKRLEQVRAEKQLHKRPREDLRHLPH
jgi:hypothetical protein